MSEHNFNIDAYSNIVTGQTSGCEECDLEDGADGVMPRDVHGEWRLLCAECADIERAIDGQRVGTEPPQTLD